MKHLIFLLSIKIWSVTPFKQSILNLIKKTSLRFDPYYRDFWFTGKFKVNYFNSHFFLQGSKEDKGSLDIFWTGLETGWDAYSIELWGKLAKKSSVIVDIGANMGLYSLAAKCINPTSKVYAFEPSIKAGELLKKNILINNFDIEVKETALSNFNGNTTFYDLNTFTAIGSLKPNSNLVQKKHKEYDVKVQTLKQFAREENLKRIDLIALDVELNEPEVLEGMGELLTEYKPDFIIEVLTDDIGSRIESFFADLNYHYFAIDEVKKVAIQKSICAEIAILVINPIIFYYASQRRLNI